MARAGELRQLIERREALNGPELYRSVGGLDALAATVRSDLLHGIDRGNAAVNKAEFGENVFPEPPRRSFLRILLDSLGDRTLIILMVAAVANIILGMTTEDIRTGWVDGVAILCAVAVVALVTSTNDWSKEKQFQALNRVAEARLVSVVRSAELVQVNVSDVVVGDVVVLSTGDLLPADGLLIEGHELKVDESAMTGEAEENLKELANDAVLLASTKVVQGAGRMLVVAVGPNSQWGAVKATLQAPSDETPLQEKLTALAERIGLAGTICAGLVFCILLGIWIVKSYILNHTKWKWNQLLEVNNFFLIAVGLIVMAVPEGLPLSVTLSLSYSMRRMVEDNCLVRKLEACETMGGATQICSDKTGTLTQNRMSVVSLWADGRDRDVEESPAAAALSPQFTQRLLEISAINSTVTWTMNAKTLQREPIGSKTEAALLVYLENRGADFMKTRKLSSVVQRVPFSSEHKFSATVATTSTGVHTMCTGAAEVVSAFCTHVADANGERARPIDHAAVLHASEQMAERGLRVLALAYGDAEGNLRAPANLTLLCLVGIKDRLRVEVPAAVQKCQRAGVTVRMLTGDNATTARSIATECGILPSNAPRNFVMEAREFRMLNDAEVTARLPTLRVLARCSPTDKHRMVRLLRIAGEVVAVTGDGTNDAPQLMIADVGFSMGSGTEVAKDASDVVLLDDSFASIVNAIKWGRNVYGCIQKFLQFQLTVTVVAVILAIVGSIIWDESPLTTVQMLWVNMIMDSFASLALATEPPTDALLKHRPYGKRDSLITRRMWRFVIGGALIQLYVLIGLLYGAQLIPWFGMPRNKQTWTSHDHEAHHTILFTTFVLMQLYNLFNARKLNDELNLFDGLHRNFLFWLILGISIGVQVLLVQFGGSAVSTTALTAKQWLCCACAASVVLPWGLMLRLVRVGVSAPNDKAADAAGEDEAEEGERQSLIRSKPTISYV